MTDQKLTHEVILDGGMFVDPSAGDWIRFFSKTLFKKGEVKGPLIMQARAIDPRFLNLLLYSPIMYQACQRARMDSVDLTEKFKAFASLNADTDERMNQLMELGTQILAQLIALDHAMQVAMQAARDGVDFERVDQFLNTQVEVKFKKDKT